MANKKVAWSGKSYGGYWGTLAFISLLKIGLVPAYGLLVFVAAFFILFRRRAVAPICAYLSKIFGCRVPTGVKIVLPLRQIGPGADNFFARI